MSRSTKLVFASLCALFVLFPLALERPGYPPNLKADEPAYYLMALSLVRDHDLRLEPRDNRRIYQEFLLPPSNVIMMTDDGWETVYFGKPYIYPFLAAPAAALAGANGMYAFNMALLMAMVWMGAVYLGRWNADGLALLFSSGFFLLSNAYAYVFWIHPEILNMAAIMACLFFGLHRVESAGRWGAMGRAVLSGAVLAVAVYNKPAFAAMGVPVLVGYLAMRRWRELGLWLAGAALSIGVVCGVCVLFTGHMTPYLGVMRQGLVIQNPDVMPIAQLRQMTGVPEPGTVESPVAAPEPVPEPTSPPPECDSACVEDWGAPGGWAWIFRIPDVGWGTVRAVGQFLIGRHTGLVPYAPFTAVALLLFLVHGRRSAVGWSIVLSLVVVALFFLIWIPFNWHGGGGHIGNRYYVSVYPGFLFLVTRLAPAWLTAVGYGVAGAFVGVFVFTPFSTVVPRPTLQAHVRNLPYRMLPLELELQHHIPGYWGVSHSGEWILGRKDEFARRGDELWVWGGTETELWVTSLEPIEGARFAVRTVAPDNDVVLAFEGAKSLLRFRGGLSNGGELRTVDLTPDGPWQVRDEESCVRCRLVTTRFYTYRLQVTTTTGEASRWSGGEDDFNVGAKLLYLGTAAERERDLYHVAWDKVRLGSRLRAGDELDVAVTLRNLSEHRWYGKGAQRVDIGYHWLTADGRRLPGPRTQLPGNVESQQTRTLTVRVEVPAEPGRYTLELDLVNEHIAWFASMSGGDSVWRREVDVVSAGSPVPASSSTSPAPGP